MNVIRAQFGGRQSGKTDQMLRDFIAKVERGVTNTGNVASRFGWSRHETVKRLRALERAGIIKSRPVKNPATRGMGWGTLEWVVDDWPPPPPKAD